MEYLTETELISILKAAKERSTRDWMMILMAYTHGLRSGEVVNIRVEDIQNGTLTVRRLKHSHKTTQELRQQGGNPLFDEVRGLKQLLKERNQSFGNALFQTKYGGPMTTQMFFKMFRKYVWLVGLPVKNYHPHMLKHTLGTFLAKWGAKDFMIKQRLGHASINSTAQYVHLNDGDSDKVVNSMMYDMF